MLIKKVNHKFLKTYKVFNKPYRFYSPKNPKKNDSYPGKKLPSINTLTLTMPFHRNFTYWIDKRKWKYVFLLKMLELSGNRERLGKA
jgi:hypothetical protein